MKLPGLIVAGLLLAGCGTVATPPAADTQSAQDETPQRGGVFQAIALRDLPHMHPWTNIRNNSSFFLAGSVYQTLVSYEYKPFQDYREQYKVVPLLSESWELKDNRVYTFRLRPGVKWHDGQPLTAADVKYSYQFLADPTNKLAAASVLNTIASISTPDESTVEITTKDPDVELLDKLTDSTVTIMAKHAHDRGDNFEKVEVGTGPYKLESSTPQRGTGYVSNKDYWRGAPYVEKWRWLPAADDAARIAAFIAGQNDVVKVGNKAQAESVLAQARTAKLVPFFQSNGSDLFFKLDRPPFNDVRVRQAVNLLVDRQQMLSTFTMGDGMLAPPGVNPIRKSWALPPSELEAQPGWRVPKEQDNARAKQLLAEAGYGSGFSFTIKMDRSEPSRPALSEMVGEQLRQAGVTAKLQPTEPASFQKAFSEGDYEAAMYTSAAPENWRPVLRSGGTLNRMPLADPELDRLIDAQAREFEPARRAQQIQELQRLLLKQAYVAPTVTLTGYTLYQPYIRGWVDSQAANVGNQDWAQAWLDLGQLPKDRN